MNKSKPTLEQMIRWIDNQGEHHCIYDEPMLTDIRDALLGTADLVRALEWYAKASSLVVTWSNYPESRSYDTIEDDGEVARKALAAHRSKESLR